MREDRPCDSTIDKKNEEQKDKNVRGCGISNDQRLLRGLLITICLLLISLIVVSSYEQYHRQNSLLSDNTTNTTVSSRSLESATGCSHDGTIIKCINIPENTGQKVADYINKYVTQGFYTLYIKNCTFPNNSINAGWLPKLTSSKIIKLHIATTCVSLSIGEGAFESENFKRCKYLTLMGHLGHLMKNSFSGLSQLQTLEISIDGLPLSVEAGILDPVATITTLQIVSGINDDILNNFTSNANLHSVQILDLSNNHLNTLASDTLQDFTSVKSLFIRSSRIETIKPGAFSALAPSIEQIILSNNNLDSLPPDLFNINYERKNFQLSLDRNNFKTLPKGLFDKLIQYSENVNVSLQYNNWICNCELAWLQSLILDKTIHLNDIPKCASPENAGEPLEDVDLSYCDTTTEITTELTTATETISTTVSSTTESSTSHITESTVTNSETSETATDDPTTSDCNETDCITGTSTDDFTTSSTTESVTTGSDSSVTMEISSTISTSLTETESTTESAVTNSTFTTKTTSEMNTSPITENTTDTVTSTSTETIQTDTTILSTTDNYSTTKKTTTVYPTTIESTTYFPTLYELINCTCDTCNEDSLRIAIERNYPIYNVLQFTFNKIINFTITEDDTYKKLDIEIEVDEPYMLLWMDTDNSQKSNCKFTYFKKEKRDSSNKFYASFETKPETSYTLCAVTGGTSDIVISPINCRAYTTLPVEDNRPWLLNKQQTMILGIFIGALLACIIIGGLIVYVLVRRNPRLIKGNKRVIVVSHRAGDVMVMPKEYYCPRDQDVIRFRRNSETSYYTARTSNSSYVTAIQPTPVQLIAWKFTRLWDRLMNDGETQEEISLPRDPPPVPPYPKEISFSSSCEMNYPYDNSSYTTVHSLQQVRVK